MDSGHLTSVHMIREHTHTRNIIDNLIVEEEDQRWKA